MELKMSATNAGEANQNGENTTVEVTTGGPCNIEAVNRISKLPVVESTIQTATNIYEKVKDYNAVTNWTLSTAESTVNKAFEVGKPIAAPVVSHLEGPIKKVDGMLCSGLDYVEAKIPAVKLPPGEIFFQMYSNTKDYVNSTVQNARAAVEPTVQHAKDFVEPTVQHAKEMVEPVVEAAKHAIEPAVQSARQIAEPIVHPAVEKACAIKDYGTQKVGELLHRNQDSETLKPVMECAECIENFEKKEKEKAASKSNENSQ